MKVLAIGNSFSQDAMEYLNRIALSGNVDICTVNLYIGGCSLERHIKNVLEDKRDYDKFVNTQDCGKSSVKEALQSENWDVITIQQASHFSGLIESYEPYGSELISYVKKYAPNSKLYFHETWAYEIDKDKPEFSNYDNSQIKMFEMIDSASRKFCAKHNLPRIPVGEVIQTLRSVKEFDYANGGESLCRDGSHLNVYGQYAAAATWFEFLTGKSIYESTFLPENIELNKIEIIKKIVNSIVRR